MSDIVIKIGEHTFQAKLHDTPTAKAILDKIPFESSVNTWGDEIYFHVPAKAELEKDAREIVSIGDLAYWPTMPAFCIFFGPTPVSAGKEPRAASKVNVFGKLVEVDMNTLRSFSGGENIKVFHAQS
jgi:hypothetical protein